MHRTKNLPQIWKYLIITVLVVAAYWPTFTGDFILDDNFLVKDNPYIMKMQSIYSYFTQEDGIMNKRDLGIYHTGFYRPLINITYFLDYKIWGMKAYGFRITNLILHLLTCIILFKMIYYFIRDQRTALWCTILFSIHPVNIESLSCVVARNNILVTLFSLSSFYFYIAGIEKKNHVKTFISIIAFICAVFTKEFGIMILPVFFLYNRFLAYSRRPISSELLSYMPFIIIALFYFYLRHIVIGDFLTPFDDAGMLKRIYFVPFIIAWNLKLIFLPYGLHQYNISYPSSFYDLYAMLSIILVLVISGFLWVRRNDKILVFAGLSFLTVIFPVLSIIPSASTSNALVSLRWLYFPLAFFLLGFAWIIKQFVNLEQILIKAILCVIICYFGIYSYMLNKYHWHDDETFFTQEVLHFNNTLYAGGLAEYLCDQGKLAEAEKYYKVAINKSPNQAYNYINYSALLIRKGKYDDAIFHLNKAKDLLMTHYLQGEWHNNMGSALLKLGDTVEALKHLNKAVILAPDEAIFWANLGGAYGMIGEYKESINALKKGLDISPELLQLRTNLAMSYINIKDYKKAVLTLEKIPEKERLGNENVLRLLEVAREGLNRGRNDENNNNN
jgi:tetratricopeptide (TPR) repeat protein